jgi:class 3 adenylate cyclase
MRVKQESLQFPAELEKAFVEEHRRKALPWVRWSFAVTLGISLLMAVTDANLPPDVEVLIGRVRYGVVCPVLLALFLLSFSPRLQPWVHTATAASMLMVGGTILYMTTLIRDPLGDRLFESMIVMSMAAYTVVRLRFRLATFVTWTLFGAYLLVAGQVLSLPPAGLTQQALFLAIVNLFGMFSSYGAEQYLRREFLLTRRVEAERQKSDQLLLNILPAPIAERLKQEHPPAARVPVIADTFVEVTVLFADIADFTPLAARMPPGELVDRLNAIFSRFDELAEQHGLEKIKTIGDAYMLVGGLPEPRPDHAEAVAEMALAMQAAIQEFQRPDGTPFRLRIGINTGAVVAGVIGAKKFSYDLWGDTVNVASRMETHGVEGAIQVTDATCAHLQYRYRLEHRGLIPVKGRGEINSYILLGRAECPTSGEGRAALDTEPQGDPLTRPDCRGNPCHSIPIVPCITSRQTTG